jgi:hypothetical protein
MENAEVQKTNEEPLKAEYDMLDLTVEILKKAGLAKEANDFYLTHHWIVEAKGKSFEDQRFLLNRYWNMQLLPFRGTAPLRYYLINDGEPADWLLSFHQKIIPFCIENNLPRQS